MQIKKKKFILPVYQQTDKLEAIEEMKNSLQHILITLIRDKETCDKQHKAQTQLLSQEIQEKQKTMQQLSSQNQELKHQIQNIRRQLAQKTIEVSSLKREKQLLERKNSSTNSIITYLQTKNKEINYQLYEAKKLINSRRKEEHFSKDIKHKSNNQNQPEYIFNKIDYPSIFDYTGVLDLDISIDVLHKTQSSPNLEALPTTTSSYAPKGVRNHSDLLKELHQKGQLFKFNTEMDGCDLVAKQSTESIKGSLKKISTLSHLLNIDSKKSLKESRKGKKVSIDRDVESWQKQRAEQKVRVGSKKLENSKKTK